MGERPYIMVTVLTYLIQFSQHDDEINCTTKTKIHSGNTALYYRTILPIRFLTDADNASDLTPYLHKLNNQSMTQRADYNFPMV